MAILNDPDSRLEYKQVNLAVKERHADLFTPPSEWRGSRLAGEGEGGNGFDVAFDLTGETAAEKPELVGLSL